MESGEVERIVRALSPAVTRLAYARTGSLADAEDAAQETFLRLLRRDGGFESDEHCKAWLLRVTLNVCADLFRSPWRRRTAPLEEAADLPAEPAPEEGGMLERVLSLPAKYRTVIHLYYYEELSTAEIAGIVGKSEDAVRARMSRARSMLRDKLEKEGEGRV